MASKLDVGLSHINESNVSPFYNTHAKFDNTREFSRIYLIRIFYIRFFTIRIQTKYFLHILQEYNVFCKPLLILLSITPSRYYVEQTAKLRMLQFSRKVTYK